MNILQQIAEETKARVAAQLNTDYPFEAALREKRGGIAFICEVKRASPSKGVIAEDFDHIAIAQDYAAAGAAAISVLTEPLRFKGADRYLREISEVVKTPLLRKDFVVDKYMIYEAKFLGASAVLLICAILTPAQLAEYIAVAHSIGLSALVETHDEQEIETALSAGARVIGVNNRNLATFEVDITLSERLRKLVPPEVLFVAESGISTPADVASLKRAGADGVLIGETIMRSADKQRAIAELRGEI